MPVKHSKPKAPEFRDYAWNDSVEATRLLDSATTRGMT